MQEYYVSISCNLSTTEFVSVGEERRTGMAPRRFSWIKLSISLVIILAAGVVVFLVARMPAPVKDVPPEEVTSVNVETITVKPVATMPDLLLLPGAIEPRLVVDVPVEERGRIEEVLVEEGEPVQEGQVLFRLDDTLQKAQFDQTKAQAEYDERMFGRSSELLEKGVVRKSEVDELRARMAVSRSNLQVARTNLERTVVKAPLTGVLNSRVRERGEYVSPGDTVAQIVDIAQVKVGIQIPEKDVRYIRMGQPVSIEVDALGGRQLTGKVTYISELADVSTRTTPIELTLDNSDGLLHAGMIIRARISRQVLRDVVMIPLSSVIPLEEGKVVYVVEDGRARKREIELGMIRGSEVQVLDGLHRGDQLIVKGHRQVGPGQQVTIRNAG